MNRFYDFIVLGAGISGCTFASTFNKNFPDASILLVENGRKIGGRSTTRESRKNKVLRFDHGLPSINLSENISQDLLSIISPLIKSKNLIDISHDVLEINEHGKIDYLCSNYKIYRSCPYMINFCEELISQSRKKNNINFLFKTLIKTFRRKNNLWELRMNDDKVFSSNYLILSSSLIAHPRCLSILNINYLPLRDALIEGKDETLDSLLRITSKQEFIKRKNFILYVSNTEALNNFKHKYLHLYFSKAIKEKLNFEKIIFQGQSDRSMVIVLHCSYINKFFYNDIDKIIQSLIMIFDEHKKFKDLFSHATLLDTMHWRASQPINNFVPKELQWSTISNIGFCGDWFDFEGCSSVETAIKSSINLSRLISLK
tara:strand:+ start:1582 stop:2697 length:1116 start_codon:yes stop_codon:yes gene_type:complete